MKRAISFILAIMMCLSLCACGASADKLYEESPHLSLGEARAEIVSNKARATEMYDGKTFVVKGYVQDIGSKDVYLTSGGGSISVYFKNKDDMLGFSQGDTITVVGKVNLPSYQSGLQMKQAYLIEVE